MGKTPHVPRGDWQNALDGALLQTLGAMVRNTAAQQHMTQEDARQLVRARAVYMLDDVLGALTSTGN